MLQKKLDFKKNNLEELEIAKKSYNIHKGILEIELNNLGISTPLMEFHKNPDWLAKWKELKEFELDTVIRNWEISQNNYSDKDKFIEGKVFEEKIMEQQKGIEKRNPEIIEDLRKLGAPIQEKQPEKQDYIR